MASSALLAELEKQFSENPRRVFARLANEYRKAGEVSRAIEICRAHVPQQPSYISGHIVLGQALLDDGQFAEARQAFETALSLDPENLIGLRSLGDIARIHGDVEGARDWYARLLEVDPQNPEVLAQLESLAAEGHASSEPATHPAPESDPASEAYGASDITLEPTPYATEPEAGALHEDHAALRDGTAPASGSVGAQGWEMDAGAAADSAATTDMVADREPLDITLEDPALAFRGDLTAAPWDEASGAVGSDVGPPDLVSFESYGEALDFAVDPPAPAEPPALDDVPPLDLEPTTLEAEAPSTGTAESAEPLLELEPGDGADAATQESAFEPAPWTDLPAEEAVAPYASAADLHGQAELPDVSFEDDVRDAEPEEASAEAPGEPELVPLAMEMPLPDARSEPMTAPGPMAASDQPGTWESAGAGTQAEESPATFVTETMAELYLRQGYREEALAIYRRLVAQHPGDLTLRDRVEQLERELAAGSAPAAAPRETPDAWREDASFAAALGFDNDVRIGSAGGSDGSLLSELDAAPTGTSPQAPPRGARARAFLAGLAERRPPTPPPSSVQAAPGEQGNVAVATPPAGVDAEEMAAARLAGGFSSGGPATRAAGDDLSLDDIFGDATPTHPGFSFDDFFSEPQPPQDGSPSPGEERSSSDRPADNADLEAFNAWLEGLKR